MEEAADAVATKGFVDGEGRVEFGGDAGDHTAYIAECSAGFDYEGLAEAGEVGGVPIKMACLRHSRAQLTRERPASSTLPMRYVSLRSACSPP